MNCIDTVSNNLLTTSLYFYSALLQADAAILAFGTVLIIYKLESLESLKQSIINTILLMSSGQNIVKALLDKNIENAAKEIKAIVSAPDVYKNLVYVVCIPKRKEEISKKIKMPIIIITLDIGISAVGLFVSQYLYINYLSVHIFLIGATLLLFLVGVIKSAYISIVNLTKPEKLLLEIYRKDIYNRIIELALPEERVALIKQMEELNHSL